MINAVDVLAATMHCYKDQLLSLPLEVKEKITDIKLVAGYCPVLFMNRERYLLKDCNPINSAEIQDLFFTMCDFSVYKHLEEIKQGFINYKKRYRVGICGTAVTENGEVTNVKDITSLTIRIPRLIYGAAEDLRSKVKNICDGILIVGEPSSGKTTVLRDLLVILSEKRLAVVDQRWELTGGLKSTELHVLYGYPKEKAINQAIRNLGAEIIICDELEEGDVAAVRSAAASGVSLIGTVHGILAENPRPLIKQLLSTGAFKYVAFMKGRDKPCAFDKVMEVEEFAKVYGFGANYSCGYLDRCYTKF